MNIKTKVRKIGNSLGIILPREALNVLKVEEGASLYVTETLNASVQITAGTVGFEEKAELVEKLMRRYRNTLRELAK